MRFTRLLLLCLAACGGGGTDPRIVAGGGIADGEIDGKVWVHVIDDADDAPLANATVAIGSQEKTTDVEGFVEFTDVEGPQTIAVKLAGYRPTVWDRANGKNVTIPLAKATAEQATLSGSITGWETIQLAQNHVKIGLVFYSQSDALGDAANDLQTPGGGNICLMQQACNWTLVTRTGTVTVLAGIADRDTKGTPDLGDDTQTIIGWAVKTGITVEAGVNQSGIALAQVEAGNLETLTVDFGTPPAALTETAAFIGFEVGDDEVVQVPVFESNTVLAPKASVFGSSRQRLTAIAQTSSGGLGAQSIVLRRNVSGPTFTAGEWMTPPVGVTAARTTASWQAVAGAKIHQVQYRDPVTNANLLEITVFDAAVTTTAVPPLVALPGSGAVVARVSGLGADIDPQDFSLAEDEDKLFAIAVQPVQVQ
jgi:hypothetical protein